MYKFIINKFKPIETIPQKKGILYWLRVFMYKLSSTLEVLVLLLLWLFIFSNKSTLGGFTREEIITYILVGSFIALITKYFLHRIIAYDLHSKHSEMLVSKPLKYFRQVIFNGLGKNVFPFFMAVGLQVLILYLFIDSFVINFNILYISVIALMVILAFITEFLLAYLAQLFIFWAFESGEFYTILVRLKKFLAGNYFPLSLLPTVFVEASLILPFAYSFFVPTELYLKKISLSTGLRGVGIQIMWIILLYFFIRMTWNRRLKKKEAKI